jgi:hypothetical protein
VFSRRRATSPRARRATASSIWQSA